MQYHNFHTHTRYSDGHDTPREMIEEGQTRMQDIFACVNMEPFPQSRVQQVEPAGGCFVNVNTPEELAAAERLFQ